MVALPESSVGVHNIRKSYPPVSRNPKGTPKDQRRCKYHHPHYCTSLGHVDARNKSCYAHQLQSEKRDVVLSTVFDEAVQRRVQDGVGGLRTRNDLSLA